MADCLYSTRGVRATCSISFYSTSPSLGEGTRSLRLKTAKHRCRGFRREIAVSAGGDGLKAPESRPGTWLPPAVLRQTQQQLADNGFAGGLLALPWADPWSDVRGLPALRAAAPSGQAALRISDDLAPTSGRRAIQR